MKDASDDEKVRFLGWLLASSDTEAARAGIVPISEIAAHLKWDSSKAAEVAEELSEEKKLVRFSDGAVQITEAGEDEVRRSLQKIAMRNVRIAPLEELVPLGRAKEKIKHAIGVGQKLADTDYMQGDPQDYVDSVRAWAEETKELLGGLFEKPWVRSGFASVVNAFPPKGPQMVFLMKAGMEGAAAAVEWLRLLLSRPEFQGGGDTTTRRTTARATTEFKYDAFICHASEDKEAVAFPLANSLRNKGFRIWYDDFVLAVGDGLQETIEEGLATSRYGIVVFSHTFFDKGWPKYELAGLLDRQMEGQKVILPVWHDLTQEDLNQFSRYIAGRVALKTAEKTIEEIAEDLAGVLRPDKQTSYKKR